MSYIFNYLIFPGFLFTAIIGMLASWIDRKVTAKVQWRVGPPILQPFYDFAKLLGKEIIIPEGNTRLFLSAPLFGLASIVIVSTILWTSILSNTVSFVGDIIVIVYLLMIPAISVMMGAFASKNSLASLGASREMKLALSYELPFILAVTVPIIKVGSIRLGDILAYQISNGNILSHPSGILAIISAFLCMQAKLGYSSFDMAEAETEISGGALIEYSGAPLAIFKLTKQMMLFVVPMFLVVLFMGGIYSVAGILKYVVLLVLIVLVKNTNPRVRIDHAVRFFWGIVTGFSIIGVILALLGY